MRRCFGSFLVLMMCLPITLAGAQGIPATDNELYAGYCLGAEETFLASWPRLFQLIMQHPVTESDPTSRDIDQKNKENYQRGEEKLQKQQQRFASYLLSRGILTSTGRTDAFIGVLTVRRRGELEQNDCLEQMLPASENLIKK